MRRAQTETQTNPQRNNTTKGALSLQRSTRQASLNGQLLDLTSTEFNLLDVLFQYAGQPVSKQDLSQYGLGRHLTRYDRSIDVHMSSIRHKLGQLADGRSYIQTIRGMGYQLIWE